MEVGDLILPLIASLWGCTNLVFAISKHLNEIRDTVIRGENNGNPLSHTHMRHMICYDWLPVCLLAAGICIGFSGVAFIAPLLLEIAQRSVLTYLISCGVAVFSIGMACIFIPCSWADWRVMNSACEEHRTRQEAANFTRGISN